MLTDCCTWGFSGIITVRNEIAKVMCLHLSVILFTGGVCLSACWDTTTPPLRTRHPPQEQAPRSRHPPGPGTPPDQASPRADTSWEQTHPRTRHPTPGADPPPPQRQLLLRTVRILLECIHVYGCLYLRISPWTPCRIWTLVESEAPRGMF